MTSNFGCFALLRVQSKRTLTVIEKQLIFQLWRKTFIENQEHAVTFEFFFLISNYGKISKGKSLFMGELNLLYLRNRRL